MKNKLIAFFIERLVKSVDPEDIKGWIDDAIDHAEDWAEGEERTAVVAVLALCREIFDIPDDIGGDED